MTRAESFLENVSGLKYNSNGEPDWRMLDPDEIAQIAMEKVHDNYLGAIHYLSTVARNFERADIKTYNKLTHAINTVKKHRDD